MKKVISTVIALVVAILFTSSSFAQQAQAPKTAPAFQGKMAQALNLTDKQIEEIAKIRTEAQMKTLDLRAQIQKYRLQIKEEMLKDNPSEAIVKKLTDKITAIQGKLKAIHVDKMFKIYNLLDDNQKKIAKRRFMRFGEGMRHKMRGRGFRGMKRGGKFPPRGLMNAQ